MTSGRVNPQKTLEKCGITGLGEVHYNDLEPSLVEKSLKRGESTLGKGGALLVSTGTHTEVDQQNRASRQPQVVRQDQVVQQSWSRSRRCRSRLQSSTVQQGQVVRLYRVVRQCQLGQQEQDVQG